MCKKKQATFPITWGEAQGILSQLGYELVSHDKANGCATFRLGAHARTEGLRNPITIAHPDFVSHDEKTPAYERDYIVDLVNQIAGGNGGKAIATFFADRRLDS